jgi:hypothetical protein
LMRVPAPQPCTPLWETNEKVTSIPSGRY